MDQIPDRNDGLREMLADYRREVRAEVQTRVRDGVGERPSGVLDEMERSDARMRADIELALLQARAQLVARIDEALRRLEAGSYGTCSACGDAIAERRLRALPFAVRCQACEGCREQDDARSRRRDDRCDRVSLFTETSGP